MPAKFLLFTDSEQFVSLRIKHLLSMPSNENFKFNASFFFFGKESISKLTFHKLCTDQIETLIPLPPGKARVFELLKIGSFKFRPPSEQNGVRRCLQMPLLKDSCHRFLVCNKACAYSRCAETLIQDGKLI